MLPPRALRSGRLGAQVDALISGRALTGDVNPEVRDMMLPSTRLCVWNPDMVVPPSELPCHGRRLMVQSLSASHGSSSSILLTDCDHLVCRVCRTPSN